MNVQVTRCTPDQSRPRPDPNDIGFGRHASDHMFLMEYEEGRGWYDPRIEPYRPLELDPAAMVLHYNQQIFDGLKAYNLVDGTIGLFRIDRHADRINRSADRLMMPRIEPDQIVLAIESLVRVDRDWIPDAPGTSLYIRPTMIATEPALGVRVSRRYLFYVIAGPAGAYYPEGFNPTRIYVANENIRAAKGGAGEAKTSGNYAPTLYVSQDAVDRGYSQVLWLDAKELKYVEEVGTSNIFFVLDNQLVTPPLEGTILPGVTRDSVLQLARSWNLDVVERPVSIDEVLEGCRNGVVREAFASGTAAVVSPIGQIGYDDEDVTISDGATGPLSKRLYGEITAIQYGRKPDPFGWITRVD